MPSERYVPAAGRSWLTPLFDPVMALTTREQRWRDRDRRGVAGEPPDDHP